MTGKLELIRQASKGGYLDGRYLAATFNMLRGSDLIWNYVVNHYLLGEDYPAFDLLFWNGDVTNLPAKWHAAYLRELLPRQSAGAARCAGGGWHADRPEPGGNAQPMCRPGVRITSPRRKACSKITEHFAGPLRFVLAGSGHIAGVVNPPDAGKYQYWTGPADLRLAGAICRGRDGASRQLVAGLDGMDRRASTPRG